MPSHFFYLGKCYTLVITLSLSSIGYPEAAFAYHLKTTIHFMFLGFAQKAGEFLLVI